MNDDPLHPAASEAGDFQAQNSGVLPRRRLVRVNAVVVNLRHIFGPCEIKFKFSIFEIS